MTPEPIRRIEEELAELLCDEELHASKCKVIEKAATTIASLREEVERLKEYEWKYKELCK